MEFDSRFAFQEISRQDLISFDIFDTALQRTLARPSDLFRVMEVHISERIGQEISSSFFHARLSAELLAESRNQGASRQVTLADIYEAFRQTHGLTQIQAEILQQFEIATEKRFLYAHPLILRLYRHARNLNKKVIFISDMYLPSVYLKEILEFHGYNDAEIFVSAEWNGNKASGRLYQIVQEKFQIPAHRCLHFGDNIYADYFRARINGWKAISTASWNRRPGGDRLRHATNIKDSSIVSSVALGLGRKSATIRFFDENTKSPAEHFWTFFGYEVVGPIYFNFMLWLCQQAQKDGIRRLLLCARDGYPLLGGFDILRKTWDIPLEVSYFFASRKLFGLAGIRELTPSTIDFLLMPNPGLTLRDFILRLDLDPESHSAALRSFGFESLDDCITHDYFGRFLKPVYKTWLTQWLKSVQEQLSALVAQRRFLVEDYFQEMEIDRSDTAVVDVGWKAASCKAVHDLIRKQKPHFSLTSYFFGTFAQAHDLIRAGGKVESFFMHLGLPSQRQSMIAKCEGLVELLFSAPHGPIIGLQRGDTGIVPIHGTCEYSPKDLASLQQMREGAYHFIQDASLLLPDYLTCPPSDKQVDRCLSQLLRYPTRDHGYYLGQMPYRASYGDLNKPRSFASPLKEAGWFPSFAQIHAYGEAPWKEGFLAQIPLVQGLLLQIAHSLQGLYVAIQTKTLWTSLRWALFRK
jgi:predicted HAD superfamily hydrolase